MAVRTEFERNLFFHFFHVSLSSRKKGGQKEWRDNQRNERKINVHGKRIGFLSFSVYFLIYSSQESKSFAGVEDTFIATPIKRS